MNPTFYPMIWFETATRIDGGSTTGRLIVIVSRLHQIIYGLGGLILSISIIILLLSIRKLKNGKIPSEHFHKSSATEPSVLSYVQLSKEKDYQISHKIEKQQPQNDSPPPTYQNHENDLPPAYHRAQGLADNIYSNMKK